MTIADAPPTTAGQLLRAWRQRRRLTQLELALGAEVSTRHLSFVETGRSQPTREMLLRLAEHLEVPLRERNELLLAGGYAPGYPEHRLSETPMAIVTDALNQVLDAHDPYPALVVDRHWELVAGNPASVLLMEGAAEHLLEPPINVLRLSLHPQGMASRIRNLGQWRAHVLHRLERQLYSCGDPELATLLEQLRALPGGTERHPREPRTPALVVPLRCQVRGHELSLFSMTTVFGAPLDVTVAELAIESFYPSDAPTAATLRALRNPAPTTLG